MRQDYDQRQSVICGRRESQRSNHPPCLVQTISIKSPSTTTSSAPSKTWDLCLDIIKDKAFWALAAKYGTEFVAYLQAFQAMRAGFASGNLLYGLFVASTVSKA